VGVQSNKRKRDCVRWRVGFFLFGSVFWVGSGQTGRRVKGKLPGGVWGGVLLWGRGARKDDRQDAGGDQKGSDSGGKGNQPTLWGVRQKLGWSFRKNRERSGKVTEEGIWGVRADGKLGKDVMEAVDEVDRLSPFLEKKC